LLTRGRFADIEDPTRPLTDAERAKLRQAIELFYKDFVNIVATSRKRPYDQIDNVAQGRVWTGAQARQNALVDELGGLDRAVEMVKQKANIPASEKITLVTYPPRKTLWDVLLNRSDEASAMQEALLKARIPPSLLHGGILALMPYRIEIK